MCDKHSLLFVLSLQGKMLVAGTLASFFFDVATETVFEPYKPKIRKSGTGCVTMINDHLYEGRFTPRVNGKRISKNVYAKTREECEEKLAELIKTMKAEIAEMKKTANA